LFQWIEDIQHLEFMAPVFRHQNVRTGGDGPAPLRWGVYQSHSAAWSLLLTSQNTISIAPFEMRRRTRTWSLSKIQKDAQNVCPTSSHRREMKKKKRLCGVL
jgi:hypothetical protein